MSKARKELSDDDRLYIVQTLNALPTNQFDSLCFALNPPHGVMPGSEACPGKRSIALLNWAEGPTGPGLIAIDKMLQKFVPRITQPEQSLKPKAFAVSGYMGDLSPVELEAIVQLLRQKTGDDSIRVAYFTEGSIKLVLNGSPEGLEKLQELFDSGELTTVLNSRSVEYVHSIESGTTEARKARLLEVLRFNTERDDSPHTQEQTRARALVLAILPASLRAQAQEQERIFNIDLRHADLSGADLSYLDLKGVDLEGTDLSYADVTGTLFGDNAGLTEANKRDLQRRGAIFQESPSNAVIETVANQASSRGVATIHMQSRYKTETDSRVLQSIMSWFDNFHELPIPQDVWLQCQLAVIEGFTNVVRHAHRGLPTKTPIEIEVTVTNEYMDIKIWDYGPGFDFASVLSNKLQQSNLESSGGRGLSIIYRVTDTVEYSRTADQRNCLHMRKYFEESF